jgi:hypothetical protein
MTTTTAAGPNRKRYPDEEFARRGPEVYRRVVLPRLTPADAGKFVVLDIETEAFEVDADKLAAVLRLHARVPGAQGWLERVGGAAPTRMRSPRRLA